MGWRMMQLHLRDWKPPGGCMAHLGPVVSRNSWVTDGDLDFEPVLIFREF